MNDETQYYRRLFEVNPNPMLVYDQRGIFDFNTATLKMFGVYSKDNFFGLQLSDLSPEFQPNGSTSKQMFNDLLQEVDTHKTANIECLCKKLSGGDAFPVEVVVSTFNLAGRVVYQVMLIDLSHYQHWGNALQTKKEIVELTLKSVDSSVITATKDGLVTYMNESACDLTQWLLDDAIGEQVSTVINVVDLVSGESIDVCVGSTAANSTAEELTYDAVIIPKGGERINIRLTSVALGLSGHDDIGRVITLIENSKHDDDNAEMQWHATHDDLTKLPNRMLLTDRFKQALFSATRRKSMLAVCMLDLDEFKPVNDSHGHAVGDLLLIEVANRLKTQLRQNDTVARLGGDEFVILIVDVHNKPELLQALQRIIDAISSPYLIEENKINISCSIGVAVYPEDDVDTDTLLRHADQAMFAAKQAGRNQVHWFDVKQNLQISSSQKEAVRIEQALENNEFQLFYQPKVNMRTGEIIGIEALIRWLHPERGIILPMEFLPVVEQSELSIDIAEWVIEEALIQQIKWQQLGKDWSVSVNISSKYFQLPSFYHRFNNVLKKHPKADPKKLEIEILESIAIKDLDHVKKVINDCKELGVSFALDDFGTGFASLSYLKQLPIDTLKIDQPFIRDILNNKENLALVQAITSLASTFGREVIAEGLETVEQGVLLMRLGCDVAQGYGIARPMPAEKLLGWAEKFIVDAKWAAWSSSGWDLKNFPLLAAQYDIREWIADVIGKIEDGTMLPSQVRLNNENNCRFGKWYKSDGRNRYENMPEFKNIDSAHHDFHRVGDEILSHFLDGNMELAQQKCEEIHLVKEDLLLKLDDLQLAAFSQKNTH
ncbi:MAG: diguanylate cyclase [Cycloclasticus sp.]|nr:MAG: diguanylate cyclase [Cycloclasticus sp.]